MQRNEGVALRIGKDTQGAGHVPRHLLQPGAGVRPAHDANDGGIQRSVRLAFRRARQFGRVDKQRLAIRQRHRIQETFRPGILHRLPKDLEHGQFTRLQFRQNTNQTDEGIDFAGGQRPHKFPFQAKLKGKRFVAAAAFPCLVQCAFQLPELHVGKVG